MAADRATTYRSIPSSTSWMTPTVPERTAGNGHGSHDRELHPRKPRRRRAHDRGGSEDITLTGNGLGNRLAGNSGSNIIRSNGGNDTLVGNDGNDELIGGTGVDNMFGGKGSETYWVDSELTRSTKRMEPELTAAVRTSFTPTSRIHREPHRRRAYGSEGGAGITLTGNNLGNNLRAIPGKTPSSAMAATTYSTVASARIRSGRHRRRDRFRRQSTNVIIENASEMENGKPVSGDRDTIYTSEAIKLLKVSRLRSLKARDRTSSS